MADAKKQVLRRCVGCGQMKDKKELIRIVRTQEGAILPDPTGRMNGRGSYLCRDRACLQTAASRKGLERSLKCRIDRKVYDDLDAFFAGDPS